jgi:hypothetical protein
LEIIVNKFLICHNVTLMETQEFKVPFVFFIFA